MKKLLLTLMSVPFFAKASEELESMEQPLSDIMPSMPEEVYELGWKMKAMMYWASLSTMHKMILAAILGLVALWIICKIFKCGKSCSCGCGGKAGCGCHSK